MVIMATADESCKESGEGEPPQLASSLGVLALVSGEQPGAQRVGEVGCGDGLGGGVEGVGGSDGLGGGDGRGDGGVGGGGDGGGGEGGGGDGGGGAGGRLGLTMGAAGGAKGGGGVEGVGGSDGLGGGGGSGDGGTVLERDCEAYPDRRLDPLAVLLAVVGSHERLAAGLSNTLGESGPRGLDGGDCIEGGVDGGGGESELRGVDGGDVARGQPVRSSAGKRTSHATTPGGAGCVRRVRQSTQRAANYTAMSNIEPAQKSPYANGKNAPRPSGDCNVGRGAGHHTPSTASESFLANTCWAAPCFLYEDEIVLEAVADSDSGGE